MSTHRYLSLCECILAQCHQKHWYGSDDDYRREHRGDSYEQGTLQRRRLTHNLRHGFEFPRATEEQLRLTEEVMGFPHPPLLRALYLHVANGGFGPGHGMTGAFGGFCSSVGKDVRYNTMQRESFLKEYGQELYDDHAYRFEEGTFDLEHYEHRSGHPAFIRLGPRVWPTYFLHLCEWDHGESYLHGKSGRVYLASFAEGMTLEGEEGFTHLYRQTDSLEEWLERWLQGESMPWNEALKKEVSLASRQTRRPFEPASEPGLFL